MAVTARASRVQQTPAMPGVHDPRTDALLDPDTFRHPARLDEALAELRSGSGLAWNGTRGFWVVARHAAVVEASRDPGRFCSSRGILVEEIGTTYDAPPTIMHTDPPAHTRYRALVAPAFRASVVRQMATSVGSVAAGLLDDLPTGSPVDVVAALAVPFPLRVIAGLLGLPDDDLGRLWRWSEAAIPGASDMPLDEQLTLLGEMTTFLLDLAAQRRREPLDDLVSLLAGVEEDGQRLSDDELGMFLIQLLVAGNETTRHAVSGGLVALAEHPDQLARLHQDRSLVPAAVEEVLRWTTPVTSFLRTATADTELDGTALDAGDPILLVYRSADRDEAAFSDPMRFDIARSPNPHIALGFGPHFCLGAALARAELASVLDGVLDRWDEIDVVGPVERTGSSVIGGIRRAELVLRAAR